MHVYAIDLEMNLLPSLCFEVLGDRLSLCL